MNNMTPMGAAQRARCRELYDVARRALESLAEERLNLDGRTRDTLNECRGKLEEFDSLRCFQPRMEDLERREA